MKKKMITIILTIFFVSPTLADDAIVNEIKGRYSTSLGKAKGFCSGLAGKLDSVKVMAGIGIASGAVGTIAGGAALTTGIMKSAEDLAAKSRKNAEALKELMAIAKKPNRTEGDVMAAFKILEGMNKSEQQSSTVNARSQLLGNIRTGTAFAAGGTGAIGAITSFAGVGTLDKLIEDMNACDSYVREIESQKNELTFAAPNDSTITQMNKIVESCKGMSSKNIADVKSKLKAAGIISAIGAAAGIAGGITSAIAVSKEKDPNNKENTKGFNTAANITSGVAAASGLGGAILSGVTLSGLNKNGDIAAKCKAAF